MPIPTGIENLSTTPASNNPAGSENVSEGDDHLRNLYAFLRQSFTAGADIASASTITPPSTGGSFNLTGTTTVTAIATTNSWSGRKIRFRHTGAHSFTQSSSLVCPGGVSITFANGDISEWAQNPSGGWEIVTYVPALYISAPYFNATGTTIPANGMYLPSANTLGFSANTTAVGSLTTAAMTMPAFAVTGATIPAVGIYRPSANTLAFASNTTQWGTLNSAGNWGLNAPASGDTLTISNTSPDAHVNIGAIGPRLGLSNNLVWASRTNAVRLVMATTATQFGLPNAGDAWLFSEGQNAGTSGSLYLGANLLQTMKFGINGNVTVAPPASGVTVTIGGVSGTHSTKIADSATNSFDAGFLVLPVSGSTTAALSDRGKGIVATGTITIPNATFAAGDVLAIYNNSGASITLTATITTMRLHGTATTGSRTLAQRGFASVYFVSGTECVVTGDVT